MTKDHNDAGWFKSSYSQADGDCVEVTHLADVVGVRDSKDVAGPVLVFPPSVWDAFIRRVAADN